MSLEQQLTDLTQAIIGLTKAIEFQQAVIDEVEIRKPEPKDKAKQASSEKINKLTDATIVPINSAKEQSEDTALEANHKSIQEFCMKLVRKDPANAQKIREVLAMFEAKVVIDVQASDLPELAKKISELK